MASKTTEILEIVLQDKASAGLSSIENSLKLLSNVALGATAAIAGISVALIPAINEAVEAENTFNKMTGALRASGQLSEENVTSFEAFASAMQETTKYGDDATKALLALSVNMGATAKQAPQLIAAAYDLAAAVGIDAEQAVEALSKTLNGEAGSLKRYGVDLSGLTEEALKNGEAIKIVGERFKGLASGEINTFSGVISQTKNSFSDLLEEIGKVIIESPSLIEIIKSINDAVKSLIDYMQVNSGSIKSSFEVIIVSFAVMGREFLGIISYLIDAIGAIPYTVISVFESVFISINEFLVFIGVNTQSQLDAVTKKWSDTKDKWASPFISAKDAVEELKSSLDETAKSASITASLFSTGQVSSPSVTTQKLTFDTLEITGEVKQPGHTSGLGELRLLDELNMAGLEALQDKFWWDEFKSTMMEAFKSVGGQLATSALQGMALGREGAADFVTKAFGAAAESIVPGSGPFVEAMVSLLKQDRATMIENVRGFFAEIPKILKTVVANLPALVSEINIALIKMFSDGRMWAEMVSEFSASLGPALASMTTAFIYAPQEFVRGILDNIDEIVAGFVNGMINASDDIADAIIDAILGTGDYLGEKTTSFFGGGDSGGGDIISEITSGIGNAISSVGSFFGFATGGKIQRVNSRISGKDVVPAKLAQGELVVDSMTTRKLESALNQSSLSGMSDAILMQILNEVKKPQMIETSVTIGSEELARAIYQINKANYRTA